MSFLEFMVSNMEYRGWGSLFGAGRLLLWGLTWVLTFICNLVEQIYNHIFSLFGVIYNENVVKFLQGWLGYLWIPVVISVIILGYNLIMGDATEGNIRVKTFARNICLFAIILFGLPYLFLGNTTQAGVFTGSNATGYSGNGTISSNSGVIDLFTNDSGSGIIKGVSQLGGNTSNASHTYGIVSNHTYDLLFIFEQSENRSAGEAKSKTWSQNVLEAKKIKKNTFQEMGSNGEAVNKAGDGIMSIDICKLVEYDTVDTIGQDKYKVSDVMVDGYDYGLFSTNDDDRVDINSYYSDGSNGNRLTGEDCYKPSELSLRQYLFKSIHRETIRDYNDEGNIKSVWYSSDGKTKSSAPFIDGLISEYPYKYKVEWGIMFMQLISTTIVMILTTYKVARIIYEIIFNHFLALFFGAADLSNGQRIKEILKSIISLLLSLLFAVVLVEFYFIITDAVETITFIPDDVTANKWMQVLVDFFIAVATVKGPSVLEKILGVEGGLSGAWRDMGAATRPARNAARTVARGTMKLAKGAAIAGAATGYYAHKHHEGKSQARNENKNGNQRKISKGKDKSRTEVAGRESQFSAINNGKKEKGLTPEEKTKTASGNKAATAEMARQSRDLGKEVNGAKTDAAKDEIANRYRGNIQNAALAEQAGAQQNGEKLGDKEALSRAYQNSGFDKAHADALASRDVSSGSFEDKKDKFDNSISANAQQRLANNPTAYSNELEAYHAAAADHYKSLGFDNDAANSLAASKASEVLIDDKQAQIRSKAAEFQRTTPSHESLVNGGSSSAPIDSSNRMSDTEALEAASAFVLGSSSVGFTGSVSDAANQIYKQGTLREGPVSGRIANNIVRERAETNTRAGSLQNDMNPATKAAATIVGGYFVERAAETLHGAGTRAGYEGYKGSNAYKTERDYKKLQKKREKNS